MNDGPLPSIAAARAVAEHWLDERDAEGTARTWRLVEPGRMATGSPNAGAGAEVYSTTSGAQWFAQATDATGRVMGEGPIPTLAEAQRVASEWLDRRLAQAQKGGTT